MRNNSIFFQKQTFFVLIMLLWIVSCRKSDHNIQKNIAQNYEQLKQQFFNTYSADPEVQKVAANIKKQDSIFKFLPDFVKKNGIPQWNKVLYQVQKGNKIIANSAGRGNGNTDEEESAGLFLIPLESTDSSEIKSYITAYKHNDTLYTYRLYNKDSLNAIHPDSLEEKKNLLNTMAVFGYFEKSINGNDSISVGAPVAGKIKNVEIGFSNTPGGRNGHRGTDITCDITITLTLVYQWEWYSYNGGYWDLISMNLDIYMTCTGTGGGYQESLDPDPGSYWWGFGSGWPYYNTGGWQNYYFDQNDPWYPWWTSGAGSFATNPFPPAELTEIDVSDINDPCLLAVISSIGSQGHNSTILRTYDQLQYTPTTPHRYKIKYETDNNLTNNNGQPIPGHTNVNVLADGTNEVVITLNPSLFGNTSKEWVTTVILHEMVHGIIQVNAPTLNTHSYMFDSKVPLLIWQSLHELFPNLDQYDGLALGMDGLRDGFMMDDPNNPGGPQIINPAKDLFAQNNYGQNISQAVSTDTMYQNGTSGTPYC